MRRFGRLVLFILTLLVAFGSRLEPARAVSDRMVVTDIATGVVIFDATTEEPVGDVEEASLQFGSSDFPSTGVFGVLLSEPAGEPPGENPVFLPGTNIVISDLILSNFGDLSVQPGLTFVSDGNPKLAAALSRSAGFPVVEETGELQDLTSLLGGEAVGWRVQVQSDVVPEPGTLALLGFGLVGLGALRRGRRDRDSALGAGR